MNSPNAHIRSLPLRAPLTHTVAVVGLVCALTACSTLPPYSKPELAVPDHYANAPQASAGWSVAAPADGEPRGPWWTLFNDPELNRLEARIDVSNQSVKKAVAQLQAARAMLDYQRAGYAPTVGVGATQLSTHRSKNVHGRSFAGHTLPDYSAGLTASWEPDLFGRVKDATVNASDTVQASEADLQAVRLSMASDLATDYFDLRSLDIQKKLLDDTVTAYAASLEIVQQQFAAGGADASALADARTQLESTRTQDTDLNVERVNLQNAIATLIGVPASSFTLPPVSASEQGGAPSSPDAATTTTTATAAATLPKIPAGVPSQLLERRPDIAAAERRVAAANARIGQAHAAFYPDLTLAATAGVESTYLGPLFSASSLAWSIGSQLTETLFDGGRRDAVLKGATAQYDATVADYRQTVLVAFQQVEDNLAALQTLASEDETQQRATAAAQLALQLTMNRFRAGAVSYLDVVTSQTIALANERTSDQIEARRIDASVALLKALGGGWDRASLTDVAAANGKASSGTSE